MRLKNLWLGALMSAVAACGGNEEVAEQETEDELFFRRSAYAPVPPVMGNVDWRSVAAVPGIQRLAVCGNGSAYALMAGGGLLYNSSIASWGWQAVPIGPPPDLDPSLRRFWRSPVPNDVLCTMNRLHIQTTDRTLYRNDGGPTTPNLTLVNNQLGGTKEIAATDMLALFVPVSAFVALNDDNSVHLSSTAQANSWQMQGRRTDLSFNRIAIGGSILDTEWYALASDGRVFANVGSGCDRDWRPLDWLLGPPGTSILDITTRGMGQLHAVDDAGTIWVGTVTRRREEIVISNTQINGALRAMELHNAWLYLHGTQGLFSPSVPMSRAGLQARTFDLPLQEVGFDVPVYIDGFEEWYDPNWHHERVTLGHVWMHDVQLSGEGVTIAMAGDQLTLNVRFEEDGIEIASSGAVPYFDIVDFSFDAKVAVGGPNTCRHQQLYRSDLRFNGNIIASNPILAAPVETVMAIVRDFEGTVEDKVNDQIGAIVADPAFTRAFEDALMSLARTQLQTQGKGTGWMFAPGSLSFSNDEIRFTVER